MKKTTRAFLCLLTSVLLLAACQPTPDKPAVVNKGDSQLEEIIAASTQSPVPATGATDPAQNEAVRAELMKSLGVTETFKDSYKNKKGDVTVNIDATVEVPAVRDIPAAVVKFRMFSQADTDRFAAYFLKGAPVFKEERVLTKADYTARIIQANYSLERARARYEREKNPNDKAYIKDMEKRIKDLQQQYAAAPEQRKRTPSTTQLAKTEGGEGLSVAADLGKDDAAEFSVFNSDKATHFSFDNCGTGRYGPVLPGLKMAGSPIGMNTSLEDAKKLVTQCLADLEIRDMQISAIGISSYSRLDDPEGKDNRQCYEFQLARIFHGVPVTFIRESTANEGDDPSIPKAEEPDYDHVFEAERLAIFVDDTGIANLQWDNPVQEESILSGHVNLKSFTEIITKAKDYMFYRTYSDSMTKANIHITSIKLGMMRITQKDKPGEFLMIPVWDFIGNREQIIGGGQSEWLPFGDESYVTVNAIDGSFIHRDWGY